MHLKQSRNTYVYQGQKTKRKREKETVTTERDRRQTAELFETRLAFAAFINLNEC